jgi:hypothetical protein
MGRPLLPPPAVALAEAPDDSMRVPTAPAFHLLLSFSDSVFCVLSLDAKLLYISPSAEKVFNIDPTQPLGCAFYCRCAARVSRRART